MVQLLTTPAALTSPAPTNCPSWCTQHDDDFQMHIATITRLEFDVDTPDSTAVRIAAIFLDDDASGGSPTIRTSFNGGELAGMPIPDAVAFALAILAQAGKTVTR